MNGRRAFVKAKVGRVRPACALSVLDAGENEPSFKAMTADELKVGNWYRIEHVGGKALDAYSGVAQFLGVDPPGYPKGSLDFLCHDGVAGVFPIHSVVGTAKSPEELVDVRTALKDAMTQMYALNHDKHVDFVLERLKPYLKDPVE